MSCVRNARSARKRINSRFQSYVRNSIGFATSSNSNPSSDRIPKKCTDSKKKICCSNHKLTSKSTNSSNPSTKFPRSFIRTPLGSHPRRKRNLFLLTTPLLKLAHAFHLGFATPHNIIAYGLLEFANAVSSISNQFIPLCYRTI